MQNNFKDKTYICPCCGHGMSACVESYGTNGIQFLNLQCGNYFCEWPSGPFMWALTPEAIKNKGGLKNAFDELYRFAENSYLDWRIVQYGWEK